MRGAAARKSSSPARHTGVTEGTLSPVKVLKKSVKGASAGVRQRRDRYLTSLSIDDKIHFISAARVSAEEDIFTLNSGKNRARIDDLFSRAMSSALDLAKLEFAGAADEIVAVRKVELRIRDLDPKVRALYAAEKFASAVSRITVELKLLQKDPRARALKMLELVKRLAKALERNQLTFLDVKHPSVFIFNGGKIIVSSYRAVEKKWGKEAQKEPVELPPLETVDVSSIDDLKLFLETSIPLPSLADPGEALKNS
jgi:hypothetical protein